MKGAVSPVLKTEDREKNCPPYRNIFKLQSITREKNL